MRRREGAEKQEFGLEIQKCWALLMTVRIERENELPFRVASSDHCANSPVNLRYILIFMRQYYTEEV